MSRIWIAVDEPLASSLSAALAACWHQEADQAVDGLEVTDGSATTPSSPEVKTLSSGDIGHLGPEDVLVVLADALGYTGAARRSDRGGCRLAARCRRGGFKGPVILLSAERGTLRLSHNEPADSGDPGVRLVLGRGSDVLPWFAPLYDSFVRLPATARAIADEINRALCRAGQRQPLVRDAVARTWEAEFDREGSFLDHKWKNYEAVLRFMRGAQAEWAITPGEGRAILRHLREQAADQAAQTPIDSREHQILDAIRQSLPKQEARWIQYRRVWRKRRKDTFTSTPDGPDRLDRPYTLLLIDDECESMGWQLLLETLLRPDGFNVLADDWSDDGSNALRILRESPVDAVLLDLQLRKDGGPGLEGFDALTKIRQEDDTVPVILFTASEKMELERRRRQLGLVGYLVKSEAAVGRRDARQYYHRLRTMCRRAVDHEIRQVLRLMGQQACDLRPEDYESVLIRLETGLADIEDSLDCCFNLGLTFEAGALQQAHDLSLLADSLDDTLNLICNHPHFSFPEYRPWLHMARIFRNLTAHSHLGAGDLQLSDAHLMSAVTVFSLFLFTGSRPSEVDPKNVFRLRRLFIIKTLTQLDAIATQQAAVVETLDLQSLLDQCRQYLRHVLDSASSTGPIDPAIRELVRLTVACLERVAPYLPLPADVRFSFVIHVSVNGVLHPGSQKVRLRIPLGGKATIKAAVSPYISGLWQVPTLPDAVEIVSPLAGGEWELWGKETLKPQDYPLVFTSGRATIQRVLTVSVDDFAGWKSEKSTFHASVGEETLWPQPIVERIGSFADLKISDMRGVSVRVESGKVMITLTEPEGASFAIQGRCSGETAFRQKKHSCAVLPKPADAPATPAQPCPTLAGDASGALGSLMLIADELRSVFVRPGKADGMVRSGFEAVGTVPFAYLASDCLSVLSEADSLACNHPEYECLLLAALGRLIQWTLTSVLQRGNPAAVGLLRQTAAALGARHPAPFNGEREPQDGSGYHELAAALEAVDEQPWMRGSISAMGDRVLVRLAHSYLLPSREKLREAADQASRQSEAARAVMGRRPGDRLDAPPGAHEVRRLIRRHTRLQNLLRWSDGQVTTEARDREVFLRQVVDEYAPETVGELEVIRQCLSSWVWTREVIEIPSLIAELHRLWSRGSPVAVTLTGIDPTADTSPAVLQQPTDSLPLTASTSTDTPTPGSPRESTRSHSDP